MAGTEGVEAWDSNRGIDPPEGYVLTELRAPGESVTVAWQRWRANSFAGFLLTK